MKFRSSYDTDIVYQDQSTVGENSETRQVSYNQDHFLAKTILIELCILLCLVNQMFYAARSP